MKRNVEKNKTSRGVIWCQKVTGLFIGVLLSGFLLFCAPYEHITSAKFSLFLVVCGGYLVVLLLSVFELLLLKELEITGLLSALRVYKPLFIFSGAFLLFSMLSALLSPYDYNIWVGMSRREGLLTQIIYIGVFLAVSIFGKLTKTHIRVFGITMMAFCIICAAQLLSLNPFFLYPPGYTYFDAYKAYSGEYIGTIGNADLSSGLLCMASIVFFTNALSGSGCWRIENIVYCLTSVAILILIQVAAGILAFGIMVLIVIPCALHQRKHRYRGVLAIESAVVMVALVCFYCFDFGNTGTLHELHEVLHGRIASTFGSSRIRIWSDVISVMRTHILWGTGPDSMIAWDLPVFTKYVEQLHITIELGVDVAHNDYLNVAAQQGIPAAFSLLCLYAVSLCSWKHKIPTEMDVVALSAVGSYMIDAFFSFSMCMVSPLFWTFLGLLNAGKELSYKDENIMS